MDVVLLFVAILVLFGVVFRIVTSTASARRRRNTGDLGGDGGGSADHPCDDRRQDAKGSWSDFGGDGGGGD